jgi:hypothetical protein
MFIKDKLRARGNAPPFWKAALERPALLGGAMFWGNQAIAGSFYEPFTIGSKGRFVPVW